MQSIWKLWVTAKSEQAARKVYARVIGRMTYPATVLSIEPYPKTNGFVVTFQVALASQTWNDAVVDVIALGQRTANAWYLTGSITDNPSAIANQIAVVGATMIEWRLIDGEPYLRQEA